MNLKYLPFIIILLPLVSVIPVWLIGIKVSHKASNILTAVTSGLVFLLTLFLYPSISKNIIRVFNIRFALPVTISFRVDNLGFYLGLIASLLWFLASLYSIEYMKHEHSQIRYNIFSLLSLCGMMGIVYTGNLLSLYIFFELMAVLSYMLVIHEETPEAMQAGMKYLFMGIVGGLILLFAILASYMVTGTLSLSASGLNALKGSPYFIPIFWSFIIGFGVKAGIFPVHVWLPDAHPVAPSPSSALLSGVMIKAGAYGIIRTIYAIYGTTALIDILSSKILIIIALITIILGSGVALMQTEIKRLLAYSSISQIGYIVLGASMLTTMGLRGGLFHILSHAFTKGTLFLCAGAFIYCTGKRELKDLKGIGHVMPLTMICFTIAASSMVGFPPLSGFLSKWFLALGAVEAYQEGILGLNWSFIIIGSLLISSILNAMYYGPIVINGWFGNPYHNPGKPGKNKTKKKDPKLIMLFPVMLLTLGIIFFGLFPKYPLTLINRIVALYIGAGM